MTVVDPGERTGTTGGDLLAALEQLQSASLDRLRSLEVDRALFVRLLETSCLLELSKLATARLDVSSYLQACCDTLTGFFPVSGCRIEANVPGLPDVLVSSGATVTRERERHLLVVQGLPVGELVVGPVTVAMGDTGLFVAAAEQIADGLGAVVEAEVLRRKAASATAARVAASLDEDDVERGLLELAEAFAALPGVLAAELVVDHPLLGPPTIVRSGFWDDDGRDHPVTDHEQDEVLLRLRWHTAPDERPGVEPVLEDLLASLDRIERAERLAAETETDPLTGLGNRRRLDRTMDATLARADRHGEQVAVLLIDLDHFKRVNDGLGHDRGDRVLVAAADALRRTVRAYDEVCRLGGEEFLVVSPATDAVGGLRLAERLGAAVSVACVPVLPEGWTQTASIGVAVFPDHATDAEALVRAADAALYAAKRAGRACAVLAGTVDGDGPTDDDPAGATVLGTAQGEDTAQAGVVPPEAGVASRRSLLDRFRRRR